MTGLPLAAGVLCAGAAWLTIPGSSRGLRRIRSTAIPTVPTAPLPLIVLGAATLVLAAAATQLGGRTWVFVLGGALVVAAVRRLVSRWRIRRMRETRQRAVIELCDALGAELRAGLPAAVALARTCEGDPAWAPIVAAARLGGDVTAAARTCAGQPGAEGLRAVAAAWEVAGRSGAALADVLDRVSAALRSEDEARAEVVAALGPPRATAKMLALLPVAGLGLGISMGASPVHFLLTTTVGLVCLVGGTVLALAGLLWVEHLAAAAEV